MDADLGKEIPSIQFKILKCPGKNYEIIGEVTLKYSAVVSSLENPSDENLEEVRGDMQKAFEVGIIDLAVLILEKWGEGMFPIISRVDFSESEMYVPRVP